MGNEFFKEFLSIHDRYRFEIKINLDEDISGGVHKIEYYFFLPASLNISHYTYDKNQFYSSLQRYIRYQSPEMGVEDTFKSSNQLSPYNKTINLLDMLKDSPTNKFLIETAVDEIKLIGSIIKAEVNKTYSCISALASRDDVIKASNHLISISDIILSGMMELKKKISSFNYESKIIDSFRYLDEYITMLELETFINIIKLYNNQLPDEISGKIQKKIEELDNYRKIEKFLCFCEDNADFFLYYRGLLKKFISSCLFLKSEPTFNLYNHIISGVASATAMLFAIIVMIYAQIKYSVTSLIFIIIAVISYVFKDRIKEFVKIMFSKKAVNFIFDRKIKITEPVHDIRIGYIKESFAILSASSVNEEIINVRNNDNVDIIDEDAKIEVVLKYKKEIKLNYDIIKKYHTRRKKLLTIIRFSISDFLKHTDDDEVVYNVLKDGNIKSVKAKRTYHMNVVVKYFSKKLDAVYERYRIIFNRSGIIKVERMT
ncbi:MAG: hypothetical protein K6357_01650 [Elusimicrobiota bacterium]